MTRAEEISKGIFGDKDGARSCGRRETTREERAKKIDFPKFGLERWQKLHVTLRRKAEVGGHIFRASSYRRKDASNVQMCSRYGELRPSIRL